MAIGAEVRAAKPRVDFSVITGLDHVVILVRDIDAGTAYW
jgi:hypothetical protein